MLSDLRLRLRSLLRRSEVERELDDELRLHYEHLVESHMRKGLTRDDAMRVARLELGGTDQIKEEHRDARGVRALSELTQDIAYGLRLVRRRPLASAAAIITLAIGIGLNAAAFSIIDWVLLRPLPYPASHELVRIVAADTSPAGSGRLTYPEFEGVSEATTLRASSAFSTAIRVIASTGAEPEHVVVARVAGDLFSTLNIRPEIGRGFAQSEIAAGERVVVISQALHRRRWIGAASPVGEMVTVDGRGHTVIGVMPAGRGYPSDADAWRPLTLEERDDGDREYVVIARLAAGISPERATPEIATRAKVHSVQVPNVWAEALHTTEVRDVRAALVALVVSAAIVLLVACVNVGAILGARNHDRLNELAVRAALGASRGRLLQQLLTEAVLLVLLGGAAGLVFGRWALDLLVGLAPVTLPRHAEIVLDMRVVGFGILATFVVAAAVATLSSRSAWRFEPRGGTATLGSVRASRRTRGRRALVALQASLAVVLTIGAGLLGRSLQHLVNIDDGFLPDRLVAVQLTLRGMAVPESAQLLGELIEHAQGVPGVQSAAAAMRLPTQLTFLRVAVNLVGAAADDTVIATLRPVTPGYFDTVGVSVRAGRDFSSRDRQNAPRVAVVNAAFVRELLHGADPIDTRLTTNLFSEEFTVVGEVADVTPAGEADRPALYVSLAQVPVGGGGSLLVRTVDAPERVLPALLSRLRSVAPHVAFDRVDEVAELLAVGRAGARFNMQIASAFAILALLLASVGIYGLTADEVVNRWHELGVRLAVGATRVQALGTVMCSSAIALGAGTASGVIIAFVVARGMESLLSGVQPSDPVAFVSAPILFATVGMLASVLAATRVLKADPATILRVE